MCRPGVEFDWDLQCFAYSAYYYFVYSLKIWIEMKMQSIIPKTRNGFMEQSNTCSLRFTALLLCHLVQISAFKVCPMYTCTKQCVQWRRNSAFTTPKRCVDAPSTPTRVWSLLASRSMSCFCGYIVVVVVALRPMSTAMVIAGRLVHLTTLFPGQAWASG